MEKYEPWFPYEGISQNRWANRTDDLIKEFPIDMETIKNIVLESWHDIFTVTNENGDFHIGKTIFPKPQMMGFFLESLINQKIKKIDPNIWLPDPTGYSKDIVNLQNDRYSLEIKTSSSLNNIYGNRSYAQKSNNPKKSKDGYYLAVNYESFSNVKDDAQPCVTLIRFGYLNSTDWVAQKANTGQQARIPAHIEKSKLKVIWKKEA